jgi:hypothetical protein
MRSIAITIHYLRERRHAFPVLVDQLRALYLTASVDLTFVDGDDIAVDPNLASAFVTYKALVERYRSDDRHSAHLIIGGFPPTDHREVAGQLLDLETRGVAVVYTRNDYILMNPRVHLLQTSAHEIGHLLNLPHPPTPAFERFDSTMNQIGNRVQGVSMCWEKAENEATELEATGKRSFFTSLAMPLDCLPLALTSRAALSDQSDISFRPWMSRFDHGGTGQNDCPCVRRYA